MPGKGGSRLAQTHIAFGVFALPAACNWEEQLSDRATGKGERKKTGSVRPERLNTPTVSVRTIKNKVISQSDNSTGGVFEFAQLTKTRSVNTRFLPHLMWERTSMATMEPVVLKKPTLYDDKRAEIQVQASIPNPTLKP